SGAETPLGTERAQGLMARTAASMAVPEETSACGEVPSYDADAGTPPRGRGRRESARAPGPLLHLAGTRRGSLRRWRRGRRPAGDRSVRRGDYRCADLSPAGRRPDRKSTRLNSSHVAISYAVFCLKKKNKRTATA